MAMQPQKWSINALSAELGMDRRTLSKRLAGVQPAGEESRGKSKWKLYWFRDVVRVLTAGEVGGNGSPLNVSAETARLKRAQAEKTELEVAERKGELLNAQMVTLYWSGLVANARARLLALPVKLATGNRAIEAQAKALIREVLDELAGDGIPASAGEDLPEGGEDLDAAAGVDGKRVGRPRKAAVKRGKRGARKVADK